MNKFWNWMNTQHTWDGWTPLQALVFLIVMSPLLYVFYEIMTKP